MEQKTRGQKDNGSVTLKSVILEVKGQGPIVVDEVIVITSGTGLCRMVWKTNIHPGRVLSFMISRERVY